MALGDFKSRAFGKPVTAPMADKAAAEPPPAAKAEPPPAAKQLPGKFVIAGAAELPASAPEGKRWPCYIAQVHPSNKKIGEIKSAFPTIPNGALIIIGEPKPIRVKEDAVFFLLDELEYYGKLDGAGELIASADTEREGFVHFYEALWLVVQDGRIIPCSWRHKRAVCDFIEAVMRELVASGSPAWLAANAGHANIPIPRLRVMGKNAIGTEHKAKGSGFNFQKASVTAVPASMDAVSAVARWMEDEAEQAFYSAEFLPNYIKRCEEIEKKAVK